ncbi:MAG: hypothetical protein ACI4WV_02925, partial [Eubacteriales bacterium]
MSDDDECSSFAIGFLSDIGDNDYCTLCTPRKAGYAPSLAVTYDENYGVNVSNNQISRQIGRFGAAYVDLIRGNLMFETEDFAWGGNRMPVTIKHLYNSALANYQYTYTQRSSTSPSAPMLNCADFSGMNIGCGWRINFMQSVVRKGDAYIYTNESGEEITFSKKTTNTESGANIYTYEDDAGNVYDPDTTTLTMGDQRYLFDDGKLIRITDTQHPLNTVQINYDTTKSRISTIQDGAGRIFRFCYGRNPQDTSTTVLTSIVAPDSSSVLFTYQADGKLKSITYPENRKAELTYGALGIPTTVTYQNLCNGNCCCDQIGFSLYADGKVKRIVENDNSYGSTFLKYSSASRITRVETIEEDNDGTTQYVITNYSFDEEGNQQGKYSYVSNFNFASSGYNETNNSVMTPYLGDDGAGGITLCNNLLKNHSFESLSNWYAMSGNGDSTAFSVLSTQAESRALFGTHVLRLIAQEGCAESRGVFQSTDALPAGNYAFSAYVQATSGWTCCDTCEPGVFLRVTTAGGTVLGESEHISANFGEYTRLVIPFSLSEAGAVKVYILSCGQGVGIIDGAQLERNDYANPYNLLTNGSMEDGLNSWTCSSDQPAFASASSDDKFDLTQSMKIAGSLDERRYVMQTVPVKTAKGTRETFTLSGWAKGYGLRDRHQQEDDTDTAQKIPTFELRAEIKYLGVAETESHSVAFRPATEGWQYATYSFAKKKYQTVEWLRVFCEFSYNAGDAFFDQIQLIRNGVETGLSLGDFDADTEDGSGETVSNTVLEGDDSTSDDTPTFEEAYDSYGNALTETNFHDGEFGTMYRSFRYSDNSNDLLEEYDNRGNQTTYTVDSETSRNEKVTDRCGNQTGYMYDSAGR